MAKQGGLVKLPEHIIRKLQPEALEQITVMEWLRWTHPDIAQITYHIPNERKQSAIWGLVMKHLGVVSGVPDICVPYANHGWHGLYIEMKTQKGRTTNNQERYIERLRENGYRAEVAYGAEQAINILKDYLGMLPIEKTTYHYSTI